MRYAASVPRVHSQIRELAAVTLNAVPLTRCRPSAAGPHRATSCCGVVAACRVLQPTLGGTIDCVVNNCQQPRLVPARSVPPATRPASRTACAADYCAADCREMARWVLPALLLLLLATSAPASARDVTDAEYARFPRLYHLDDYSSCLAREGGLYCLGSFHLAPLTDHSPLYSMLEEYSREPHHFNRTQLHRGYCVSSRCAALAAERNASLRFERCAAQWARRLGLRPSLARLHYCRSHAQDVARAHSPDPLDIPQRLFLYVLAAILALNILGTTYDVVTADNPKKNWLSSWSMRFNWRRLTTTHEDGDPRLSALTPVQGVRVLLMVLTMATHSACIQVMLYVYNPRWIEQISRHPILMLFLNGTSVVQIFVMLSNFLLGYNLLLFVKDNKPSFSLLPYIFIKRIARISPVYLLVVGYAATWWPRSGAGPMWTAFAGAESAICRRKFWTHVLFINNLVDPNDICLVQTWFPAVDTQLHVVAAVLALWLARRRARAVRLLLLLAAAASALTGLLAYVFQWESIVYYSYPKNLNTMYKDIPSFSWLYQAPWGSLAACLIGLLLAFVHFEIQESGVKVTSLKSVRWLRRLYSATPVLMASWILAGNWLRGYSEPWFTALYAALERPVLSLLAAGILLGMINGFEGWLKHVMAWRGWHAMGRMSLSVLMVHWCINVNIAASRLQPTTVSLLSVLVDWVATSFFSYVVAVPLTVMVEMPVQRVVTSLLASRVTKQA
ncbi:O-acyltransferase like protein-like isoform X1 [Spodoptera frugiperda]|uniref:O-acyltransferase like protein-like isoform X1 n=2 Tax=Spodoptera frugiperda TaxID=7108 RepID=A0A9R0DU07_SPOFR|nr:O-acyltransferase like protein-like isoform X1 [Spodoptera frugiperda]